MRTRYGYLIPAERGYSGLLALLVALSGGRVLVHDHIGLGEAPVLDHLQRADEVDGKLKPHQGIGGNFEKFLVLLLGRRISWSTGSAAHCRQMASCVRAATDTLVRSHSIARIGCPTKRCT